MLKKYKMGFDIWGLILFLIIMIPNFIWFSVPAPVDILREDSVTGVLDAAASVCQALMLLSLCVLINPERKKSRNTYAVTAAVICCLLYYGSWALYYSGVTAAFVILGLTITPCLAFLLFAVGRKNIIAVVLISIFSVCHFIYGIANFIIS